MYLIWYDPYLSPLTAKISSGAVFTLKWVGFIALASLGALCLVLHFQRGRPYTSESETGRRPYLSKLPVSAVRNPDRVLILVREREAQQVTIPVEQSGKVERFEYAIAVPLSIFLDAIDVSKLGSNHSEDRLSELAKRIERVEQVLNKLIAEAEKTL